MSISLHPQTIHTIRVRLLPNQYQSKGPHLKDRICIYFQKKQVSGGCDVDDVNIVFEGSNGLWMTVTFSGPSGVQHVLAKHRHELDIDGIRTSLEVHAHDLLAGHSPRGSAVYSDIGPYMESFRQFDVESINKHESSDSAPDQSPSPSDDASSGSYSGLNPEDPGTSNQPLHAHGQTVSQAGTEGRPSPIENQPPVPTVQSKTHVRTDISEQEHRLLQESDMSGKVNLPLSPPLSQATLETDGSEGLWPDTNQPVESDDDSSISYGEEQEDDSEYELKDLEEDGDGSEDELQDREEEDAELVVEVTDFKPTSSDEILKLYFESNRRSGGGDIKTWERDSKTGTIKMTFESPPVAWSVVDGRAHRADGATLSVRLILKKKPRPRPLKKRCLFLRGIPDGCSPELVALFIENRSGMDEPEIEYGEMPGTALCTFKEDIPDVETVMKRIASKKLQEATVTAETVHETDSILVQGLSATTSLVLIELFFDNKKKSGGSGVRDVKPGPADGQAVVYFEDWKVVGEVLSKCRSHTLDNTNLTVEEYHDSLGRVSLDAPTPHIPKPVSVPVNTSIMEFIFGKGEQTKKNLIKELSKVTATLQWPDGNNKTSASLEPLLEDGQRQSSWLKWPETATAALTDFLGRCKSSRIPIPQPLWKDATAKIDQLDIKSYSIEIDAHWHIVCLVGEQQDVEKAVVDVNSIIQELRAKAEYKAQQKKQGVILPPLKLQLFTICGIKDDIEKSFPDMKISVAPVGDKMGLILEGTRKDIQKSELSLRRQIDNLEPVEFKTSVNKVRFIRSLSDKFHEILGSQGIRAACSVSDDGKITVYGATKMDAVQVKAYIDQEIEEEVIAIKETATQAVLQSQDWKELLDEIEKQKLVAANINQAEDSIELAGFRTSLEEAKQSIMTFLKDNVIKEEFIRTTKTKMRIIRQFHEQELDKLAKENENNQVKIVLKTSDGDPGFSIQGNEEGLNTARRFVDSLIEKIDDTNPPSIDESDQKETMVEDADETVTKQVRASLKPRRKARSPPALLASSVDVEASKTPATSLPYLPDFSNVSQRHWDPTISARHVSLVTGLRASPTKVSSNDVEYVTGEGMNIVVRRGDITKQLVCALVNPSDSALINTGGVSRAIMSAAGAPLQKYCFEMMKHRNNQKLTRTECIVTPGFKLNCLIIHAVGPDGHQPNYNRELYNTFLNCLLKAEENEVQSVAIPLIGSGSARQPKDVCADSLVSALLDFSLQSSKNVRDVLLVNIDKESNVAIAQALQKPGVDVTLKSMP